MEIVRVDGRRGLDIDCNRLGGESGFGNLQPVSAEGQISESRRPLRISLKIALPLPQDALQLSRSLHRRAGGILDLQADLALTDFWAQQNVESSRSNKRSARQVRVHYDR